MKNRVRSIFLTVVATVGFSVPLVSRAAGGITCPATGSQITNVTDFINIFTCMLNTTILPLLVSLAVVFFLWGVTQYVINPTSSEEREKGQQYMVWGLIGLFVIVSIWGLVSVLTNTFGISVLIPQLQQ